MQRVARMLTFISGIAMAQKMATTNPLDQLLSSDVDESVISALVGSLESQLASPTSKDSPQQNSSTSVNNNHIAGAQVENATSTQSQANNHAGQKTGLIANNSQITITAANGNKESISQGQLLALNSVAGISLASTNSSQGVTLLSSVNSHCTTPVTATGTTNVIGGTHGIPNVKFTTVTNSAVKPEVNAVSTSAGIHKQIIVTVGSTNQGTVVLGTTQHNSLTTAQGGLTSITGTSTNSVNSGTTSITGTAIYDLASIAAEQQPLQVPTSTHAKGLRPGQLTVREQLEKQQKDIKPNLSTLTSQQGNVSVNIVNTVHGTNQFTVKQEHTKVKQEVKLLGQNPSVSQTQGQTISIVTSKSTPNCSGVITLTKQMPNQQTMTVARPQTAQPGLPPGTQTIQIVNTPRMAGTNTAQQKTLAPRMVGAPVRIVSQPQIRSQGSMHGTVTLPPGLQLPPGTVLVQNEQGQLVFLTGQQGGLQQQTTASTIAGTPAYKIQTVKPGTPVSQVQTTAAGSIQFTTVRPQAGITTVSATRPQITTQQQLSTARFPGSLHHHDPRARASTPAQLTTYRPSTAVTRLQTPISTPQMRRLSLPPPQSSTPPLQFAGTGSGTIGVPRHQPVYRPHINGGEGGSPRYCQPGSIYSHSQRPIPPYPVHHRPPGVRPGYQLPATSTVIGQHSFTGGLPSSGSSPSTQSLHTSPHMGGALQHRPAGDTQMGVGRPMGMPPTSVMRSHLRASMASTQVTSVRQAAPVMAARLQSPLTGASRTPSPNPAQHQQQRSTFPSTQVIGVPSSPTTIIGQVPTVVTACQVAATQRQPIAIATPGMPNVIQTQAGAHLSKGGQVNLAIPSTQPQSIMENVKKCKNFLSTLIKLASSQPADTVKNVKNLIQGLIDGKIQPEDFTGKLQVELKSSPQPCLVPFLKKSLPLLRQSMSLNKMQIDGVRPPPLEMLQSNAAALAAASSAVTVAGTTGTAVGAVRPVALQPRPVGQQFGGVKALRPMTPQIVYRPQLNKGTVNQTKALLTKPQMLPTTVTSMQAQQLKSPVICAQHREKRKYEALNRDDDDINDVATMGGVNLTEESRNILATNSELMSGQLRSCQDESFLATQPLLARINERAKKLGLEDTPTAVAQIISHATQEMLRNMCAKLANIAEHRLEIYKADSKHEVKNEVKVQLKFLEELDQLEKKRHEEAEREILLRAAKSRSKHEDPEQLKLKEKAKALQQAEMEEVRQREANLTALAAIGPRKKKKPNEDAQQPSGSGSSASGSNTGMGNSQRTSILRPRIKRVNLRDLIFLMEQDRESTKSTKLYCTYLK